MGNAGAKIASGFVTKAYVDDFERFISGVLAMPQRGGPSAAFAQMVSKLVVTLPIMLARISAQEVRADRPRFIGQPVAQPRGEPTAPLAQRHRINRQIRRGLLCSKPRQRTPAQSSPATPVLAYCSAPTRSADPALHRSAPGQLPGRFGRSIPLGHPQRTTATCAPSSASTPAPQPPAPRPCPSFAHASTIRPLHQRTATCPATSAHGHRQSAPKAEQSATRQWAAPTRQFQVRHIRG